LALVEPRGATAARSSLAFAVSVTLAGSYAPPALAQETTADLDTVIVTARKREETLLEIPQEIQAISQQEMELRGSFRSISAASPKAPREASRTPLPQSISTSSR
jgi:outer membrane receptor protein involved in Fe transport